MQAMGHMALVGQEPVLYARSIRDNISYGCEPYGWTPRYRLAPQACGWPDTLPPQPGRGSFAPAL